MPSLESSSAATSTVTSAADGDHQMGPRPGDRCRSTRRPRSTLPDTKWSRSRAVVAFLSDQSIHRDSCFPIIKVDGWRRYQVRSGSPGNLQYDQVELVTRIVVIAPVPVPDYPVPSHRHGYRASHSGAPLPSVSEKRRSGHDHLPTCCESVRALDSHTRLTVAYRAGDMSRSGLDLRVTGSKVGATLRRLPSSWPPAVTDASSRSTPSSRSTADRRAWGRGWVGTGCGVVARTRQDLARNGF